MAQVNQNFTMYSGNSEYIYVNITDKTGKAEQLEGCTLKWAMKQNGKTIASKDSTNGIGITDSTAGRVCIKLQPADTHLISGSCNHELVLIDGDGNVTTVMTGNINILQSLLDN